MATRPKLKLKKAGRKPLYPWKAWESAGTFTVYRKDYRGAPHGMAAQIRNKFAGKYSVSILIRGHTLMVSLNA